MDFLIELMRPTFRSYYDLIRYISLKKCRKMTEPSEYGDSLDNGNTGVEFSSGGTKLEKKMHENQHTHRKVLNFENWCCGDLS